MSIERLADLGNPDAAPRVVFKVGSALLCGADGKPRRAWLQALVAELAEAVAASGLKVRLNLQLHKYIWGAHARGV